MIKMEKIKIKYFEDIEELKYIDGKSDWIDLRASKDVTMHMGDYVPIPLGIAMELPKGYEAIMAPRSSTYKNFGIILANSIGVIDESYKGDNDQWHFPAICLKPNSIIKKGDRIAQFRIIKHQPEIEFIKVEKLDNKDRNGIGSTGIS